MFLFNKSQQDVFKVYEDGNDNVSLTMAKINSRVSIGTTASKGKLEIAGAADGKTYANELESRFDGIVLNIGNLVGGSDPASVGSRSLSFLDRPVSNIFPKAESWFGITDRNDATRFRHYAQTNGGGHFDLYDKVQTVYARFNEDGNGNVFMDMPKPNSRVVIAGWGDYLPEHKLVVRGSSKIEGNILTDANIGIGTNKFDDGTDIYRLSVNGFVRATKVKVYNTWADYVFNKEYNLRSLNDLEAYIKENGHLPNVPSAKEVEQKGLDLGDMSKIQQEKIEELTLYLIQQNKEIQELKEQVKALMKKK